MRRQIVVDENDNIIRLKERNEITNKDIYRVSVLWVRNSKDQVLIAQRALNKSHDPGKWQPAVAGTVEEGESYEENIIKESKEELGLNLTTRDIILGPKLFLRDASGWLFFCQLFIHTTSRDIDDFNLQRDEVIRVQWIEKSELDRKLRETPKDFVDSLSMICKSL